MAHAALKAVTQTPGGIAGYSAAYLGRSQASRWAGAINNRSARFKAGSMFETPKQVPGGGHKVVRRSAAGARAVP